MWLENGRPLWGPRPLFSRGLWGKKLGGREELKLSLTKRSFSMRSARALQVMLTGFKPRSPSFCCLYEPKPKAACQSVDDDTGLISVHKEMSCEQASRKKSLTFNS